MGEHTQTEILRLFQEKLDEIDRKYDEKYDKIRKTFNGFMYATITLLIGVIFSAGTLFARVSFIKENQDAISNKVDRLIMMQIPGYTPVTRSTSNNDINNK